MKTGILYIVPMPIGNLGDMTHRAVEVLHNGGVHLQKRNWLYVLNL